MFGLDNCTIEASPSLDFATSVGLSLLFSLAMVASILVILLLAVMFAKNKSLVTNSVNLLIINVAVANFGEVLLYMPLTQLSYMLAWLEHARSPALLNLACNLHSVALVFFKTLDLALFTAMSYERLAIIRSPFIVANKRIGNKLFSMVKLYFCFIAK